MDVVRLWRGFSNGMGAGYLPDDGGLNNQSSWLIDAFNILQRTENELKNGR